MNKTALTILGVSLFHLSFAGPKKKPTSPAPAQIQSETFLDNEPTAPARLHTPLQNTKITPPKLPAAISFAGEPAPLKRWDVRERLDRELLINCYMHGSTLYILKLAHRTFPVIERILKEQGVPDDFKYLAVAESALYNQISKAGATGYWQFLKASGIQFGLEITDEVDMRYDLEASTLAACKYLKQAYQRFGNWTAAAASYNMGMGGYSNYSKKQYESNYYNLLLPEETNRYVYRILALKTIIGNPEQYGFHLDKSDVYPVIKGRTVQVTSSIPDLAAWAKQQGTTYQQIKIANQWLRAKSLTVKPGKVYNIFIPEV